VAEAALDDVKIVDVGGGDPPSSIDECMEAFAWCEIEMEEIVVGGVQVARSAV
jgi:hypothetical protein